MTSPVGSFKRYDRLDDETAGNRKQRSEFICLILLDFEVRENHS
jgi:hypothetical protein